MQFKLKLLSLISLIFLLTACGYKPSTHFSKKVLGDRIYVDLSINIKEPENSVLIKDAINEAIYNRFRAKLTTKEEANTFIKVKLKGVKLTPLSYDKNGYAVLYKNHVKIKFDVLARNQKKYSITSEGSYSFTIVGQSVISDKKKFDAIKVASSKAIDKFISNIAYHGCISEVKKSK